MACVSGTDQPFFTVCFDYEAVKQGACDNAGISTGCWYVYFTSRYRHCLNPGGSKKEERSKETERSDRLSAALCFKCTVVSVY